jgi:hypothetical protein
MSKFTYEHHKEVAFDYKDFKGVGLIKGASVHGKPSQSCTFYMIQPVNGIIPSKDYPFSIISVPETHIKPYPAPVEAT